MASKEKNDVVEEQPPSKKARLDTDGDKNNKVANCNKDAPTNRDTKKDDDTETSILDPINPAVLSNVDKYNESYRSSKPYPHCLIEKLCPDGFLEQVLDEIKQNSKVKFKESDLFRVYQSIDLGNITDDSPMAKNLPSLMKLKHALYSEKYRSFVEKIANLEPGTLTDEVDCAANCHTKGCHLLCHDDVIGNRKVSYIIYLTEPDSEWTDEDGGRLELYDNVPENEKEGESNGNKRRAPGPFPVKTYLPKFNSLAYFVVTPGESFHSVQEVFCDKPRLSIQGWYHAKEAPSNMENATLSRLKSTAKGEDTEGPFMPLTNVENETNGNGAALKDDGGLSPSDKAHLAKYINPTYLEEKNVKDIRECFEEESSVQLLQFFNEEWAKKIKTAMILADEKDNVGKDRPSLDYNVGVSDQWKPVGPAHKQRFLEYVGDDNLESPTAGSLLLSVKKSVFESSAFGRWLKTVTSLDMPEGHRGRVRRFRPGLDYTVAHYGILTKKSVLDATMCFVAGKGEQCKYDEEVGDLIGSDEDATWESGDVGGFECYIAADDEGENKEADAEYKEDDDTELLSVAASFNTLSLVYRDPGTMRFVKYVGSGAPSSRWDLSLEYNVPDDDDTKDGEDIG